MKSLLLLLLLLCLIYADPCPKGYAQAADGGDCYNVKSFFDSTEPYTKTSYNQAEMGCNDDSGGLLASIHSQKEQDMVFGHWCQDHANDTMLNIGLRCTGKVCQWDDGTNVTYTNFARQRTSYDGSTCFGMDRADGLWKPKFCGYFAHDCWACRVKARTIECAENETEYKGGCISVHNSPLDQKSAEDSCPGGGHLVSIHANLENDRYRQLARDAGINGTIHIGGKYTEDNDGEVIEWNDGSNYNFWMWAKGFPSSFFGHCVQMLLDSEFGVQGQWTNIDCGEKLPYICFRDGAYFPTEAPQPKADVKCPPTQYSTGSGIIYSPNYPLFIPRPQSCVYVITTKAGTRAGVSFPDFDCKSAYSLLLFNENSTSPFITMDSNVAGGPELLETFLSKTNVLRMVFTANESSSPDETGWAAVFNGYNVAK